MFLLLLVVGYGGVMNENKGGNLSSQRGEDTLNGKGGKGVGCVCIMAKVRLNVTCFVSEINLSGNFPNSCFELAWTEIGQGHRNSLNDCFVNVVILSSWAI